MTVTCHSKKLEGAKDNLASSILYLNRALEENGIKDREKYIIDFVLKTVNAIDDKNVVDILSLLDNIAIIVKEMEVNKSYSQDKLKTIFKGLKSVRSRLLNERRI